MLISLRLALLACLLLVGEGQTGPKPGPDQIRGAKALLSQSIPNTSTATSSSSNKNYSSTSKQPDVYEPPNGTVLADIPLQELAGVKVGVRMAVHAGMGHL